MLLIKNKNNSIMIMIYTMDLKLGFLLLFELHFWMIYDFFLIDI